MTEHTAQGTNGRSNSTTIPAAYPARLASLQIRPIRDEDTAEFQHAFRRLSETSRYYRFFSPMRELPTALAHYLTHVDGVDHVALVAIDRTPGHFEGIADARFVRDLKRPDAAELAITVVDAAQGRGVAGRLLEELALYAHARGVRVFTMAVLSGNHRARRMIAHLGATARGSEGEVVHFELPVDSLIPGAATAA
jgi:GNAT superfamily N-acetyltransferase